MRAEQRKVVVGMVAASRARSLAAVGTGADVGTGSWLDSLPLEDDRRTTDGFASSNSLASARVLAAEAFEQAGRHTDALRWARAELSDPLAINYPSKCRAGRVLGRCHAVLGESSLSLAAFDAALQLAEQGRYLLSGLLTVRARAAAGMEAGGDVGASASGHWSEATGRQRLSEAVGRMEVGMEDRGALEASLLPPAPAS